VAAIAVLGVLGSHVEERLTPSSLAVPGTPSDRGSKLLRDHFGESAPFAILLRGPAAALDRQGPRLVRELHADPDVSTLSPWDTSGISRLRPGARRALILVDFHVPLATAVRDVVPRLDRILEERVEAPVRATETGYATLSRAIQDQSISSTERAELLAIPFLLVVLLLVFRSPVAALIPLFFGGVTVLASRGLLYLASHWIGIDAFALTVATMMGLALGVDYALLMVSRFREEMAAGSEPLAAAWRTRRTAGRTIAFAGTTLFVSMAVSVLVLPGSLLLSLAGTAILVTAISVAVAVFLAPALLCVLGSGIDRWRIGREPNGSHTLLSRMLGAALARPVPVAALIATVLLLLAAPALAIRTGPPSPRQLPESDPARQASELIAREMGPGWDAPFVLVAASEDGPITSAADLRHLARFQRVLAAQPGVQTVIGPSAVATRTRPLRQQGRQLLGPPGARKLRRLSALGPQLERAGDGVGLLRTGLADAAAGAGLLGEGSGRAQEGASRLADGLSRAAAGGDKAATAVGRLADGADRIAEGGQSAKAGSLSLLLGLHDLLPQLRKGSLSRARRIRSRLDALAREDPALEPVAREAAGLVVQLAGARNRLRSLRGEAQQLHGGLDRLAAGTRRLAGGTSRLAGAASELGGGLERLHGGAGQLASGLVRLQGGSESLASHLSDGYARSAPLEAGLHRAGDRVVSSTAGISRQRSALRASSPGLFDSGYFVLSALDGAQPAERAQAGQAIDLDHGGQAAAILVVSRFDFDTASSEALYRRLSHLGERFTAKTGLRTGVAGGAAQLADYNQVTRTHVPLVILAMTVVTFLALIFLLRAVILAALAVLLNLMTVGVAFGVLVLLFDVPAGWPLGGHDYVDAIGAAAIFGIVFGLSIDYAVFLLARMREAYEADGDHRGAITFGLERTARVITGAAAIMMAVFVCFAAAPIATVSQLGIGLAVAVLLDATVVRIVLLPALMLLIGERVWWLPAPLARALPRIELHPT